MNTITTANNLASQDTMRAEQLAAEATRRANEMPPVKSDSELAMEKAREEQKAEQRKQEAEYAKLRQERIRTATNNQYETRPYFRDRQPEDSDGKPIGNRGYAWKQNFKAGDGNWFAEYRANVGGQKLRIYAISEKVWWEEWETENNIRSKQCPNCQVNVYWRKPSGYNDTPIENTCTNCSHKYYIGYYGQFTETL